MVRVMVATTVQFLDNDGEVVAVPAYDLGRDNLFRLTSFDHRVGALPGDHVVALPHPSTLGNWFVGTSDRCDAAIRVDAVSPDEVVGIEQELIRVGLMPLSDGLVVLAACPPGVIDTAGDVLDGLGVHWVTIDPEDQVRFSVFGAHQFLLAVLQARSEAQSPVDVLWAIAHNDPALPAPLTARSALRAADRSSADSGALAALGQLGQIAAKSLPVRSWDPDGSVTWTEVFVSDDCSAGWGFHGDSPTGKVHGFVWTSLIADRGPDVTYVLCPMLASPEGVWLASAVMVDAVVFPSTVVGVPMGF